MTDIMKEMEKIKEGDRIKISLNDGSGLVHIHRVRGVESINGGAVKRTKITLDFFFYLLITENEDPSTLYQNTVLNSTQWNVGIEILPS